MTETKQGIMTENDMSGDEVRVNEEIYSMALFQALKYYTYKTFEEKEVKMEADEEKEVKKEADEETESHNMQVHIYSFISNHQCHFLHLFLVFLSEIVSCIHQ